MAFNPSHFIVAIALVQSLAACSSASLPAPDKEIAAQESRLSKGEPTISSPPLPEPKTLEKSAPTKLIGNQDRFGERILRPLLAIDSDAAAPLPDVLSDGAEVSYIVVDLERGIPVAQHNADHDQIPASSAKLATAVIALQLLGPEHRFLTELRATGPIENGVLKGDLILKGGGDPVLDIPDLLPLIDELASRHVRSIEGRFLIDDTLLPRFAEIEPSQPTEAAYNPGLGALSLAFNRVNLRWNKRGALTAETVPHLDEASFESAASDLMPPGGVQLKQIDVEGAIWQLADKGARRSKRSLPVKDAGLHAGQVFAHLTGLYGIELPAPKRVTEATDGRLLAVHKSRPLRLLVRDMLWYSNNLVAEMIGLAAAMTVEPELASLENSAAIVLGELEKRLSHISWDKARLNNHSGLNSESRLTSEQLAAVLRHGWRDGTLTGLLPASGWSGTLARRFNSPDQAFRIWAKTGSMNYVTTLGGYLLSPSHSPAAFVIMISDQNARTAYDAEPRRTRASEKRARAWKDNAELVMNHIVEGWLAPAAIHSSRNLYALTEANKESAH
ncbi:MAG: D-alanyl-D-alanine carboxypeptidase/D-alanyl-D-alanine endopeptidase [Geminicoccaceae bacterium]